MGLHTPQGNVFQAQTGGEEESQRREETSVCSVAVLAHVRARVVITFPSFSLFHREQQRQEEARRRRQVEQEEVKVKTTGCVLHFSGCGPDTSREDLKVYSQLPPP